MPVLVANFPFIISFHAFKNKNQKNAAYDRFKIPTKKKQSKYSE